MSSEIRLVPSWYGKIPLEKGSPKLPKDNTDNTDILCCGGNENDKYVSPVYNEPKEYLESLKPFSKLPTLDEKFELDEIIRPLYKHFLNGSEFYKFYLNKVKNNVLDRNSNDTLQQPTIINTSQNIEISRITNKRVIQGVEHMLDEIEPVEEIENYKTKGKKVFDDYEDDFDDRNYNYSDDDYHIYSDFELDKQII